MLSNLLLCIDLQHYLVWHEIYEQWIIREMVVVSIRLLTAMVNKGSWNKQLHMINKLNIFVILQLLYRVSQEECARLRESVPYVKVYQYNPKHLYPKLNGYGDNGQRKVRSSCGSTYCTCSAYALHLHCACPWEYFDTAGYSCAM